MRAAIFIDGGYFLSQIKNKGLSPDYQKLTEYLMGPLRATTHVDLMRCYFYYCAPWMSQEPTKDELRRMEVYQEFAKTLEDLPRWQVRHGKLERRRDGDKEYFEQKRVDVLLSVDLTRHAAAGHIQHALLVAGDSDFIPAISAAKEEGVTMGLWCGPDHTAHKDLVTLADEVHRFDWRKLPQIKAPGQKGSGGRRSTKKQSTQKKTNQRNTSTRSSEKQASSSDDKV